MISEREARGDNPTTATAPTIRGARISLRILTNPQKVPEDLSTELGVFDFRMEL